MYNKDELLCLNMLESVNKIIEISDKFSSIDELLMDYVHYDAILMNFIIIGEMATRLSEEYKEKHSNIDWHKIKGFRNIIVHDYFGIDDKAVWQIIKTKIPELKIFLEKN